MGLKAVEWTLFLCVCGLGIQTSFSFIQNMREIEQNCFRDGGYCINVIPPPPPRRRNNRRRGGPGGRMGTRTRSGTRPDPRALGQQHTRLPGGQKAGGAGAGGPPPYSPAGGAQSYPPAGQSPAYDPAGSTGGQAPAQQNNPLSWLFGSGSGSSANDPFNSLFGMMMFTRKKRQIPEPHERPRIRRGQSMYSFLNQHCRKSEFDFGCRKQGGMCCLPFLK